MCLSVNRAVLSVYRPLLCVNRAVLSVYRPLLSVNRAVLSVYRGSNVTLPRVVSRGSGYNGIFQF